MPLVDKLKVLVGMFTVPCAPINTLVPFLAHHLPARLLQVDPFAKPVLSPKALSPGTLSPGTMSAAGGQSPPPNRLAPISLSPGSTSGLSPPGPKPLALAPLGTAAEHHTPSKPLALPMQAPGSSAAAAGAAGAGGAAVLPVPKVPQVPAPTSATAAPTAAAPRSLAVTAAVAAAVAAAPAGTSLLDPQAQEELQVGVRPQQTMPSSSFGTSRRDSDESGGGGGVSGLPDELQPSPVAGRPSTDSRCVCTMVCGVAPIIGPLMLRDTWPQETMTTSPSSKHRAQHAECHCLALPAPHAVCLPLPDASQGPGWKPARDDNDDTLIEVESLAHRISLP